MTTTAVQFVPGPWRQRRAGPPVAANAQVDQVKVYFGFPAGSSGDTVARRVAEKWAGSAFSRTPAWWKTSPAQAAALRWRR